MIIFATCFENLGDEKGTRSVKKHIESSSDWDKDNTMLSRARSDSMKHEQALINSEEEDILELQSSDVDSSSDDEVTRTNDKRPQNPTSRGTSVWKSAFNIGNYIEGVGFLALPFAVAKGGIATIVSFVLLPFMFCYSGNILIECLYDNDKKRGKLRTRKNFKDLGEVLSSKYGGLLTLAGQQLSVLLTSVSYLVICGSLLYHAIPSVPLTQTMWIGITGVVVLPTAFLKTLSQIAWLSFVSIVALIGVVVGVVWYGAEHTDQWNARSLLFWDTEGAIVSFSIVVLSNGCFVILPSVEESMADRSKFSRTLCISYAITTTIKLFFSLLAFLSFQFHSDEIIINNLPAGPILITLTMLFVFTCCLSYAPCIYLIVEYLHQTTVIQAVSAKISDRLITAAVRITVVLVTVLLAVIAPHFAILTSFTGSLFVSFMSFILPNTIHLKLKYHELKSHQIILDLLLVCFGVILCVVGVVVSGKTLIETF